MHHGELADLHELLLSHALGAMMRQSMADLVAEYRRQTVLRFGYRKDAGIDDDFAAGQAEGVDLLTADDAVLPLEALLFQFQTSKHISIVRGVGEPAAEAADDGDDWSIGHHGGFLQHLRERLRRAETLVAD